MPKAGFCNECKKNVWLTENGGCVNGHPPNMITGVCEASYQSEKAVTEAQASSKGHKTNLNKPKSRFLKTAIVISFVCLTLLVIAIAGGYRYYSSIKANLEAEQRLEDTAYSMFQERYHEYRNVETKLHEYPEGTEELSRLSDEYDHLRVQRNDASGRDDYTVIKRLTNKIGAILDKKEEIYDKRADGISDTFDIISSLSKRAHRLSDEERDIARRIAEKAQEKNRLEGDYIFLAKEQLIVHRNVNEEYRVLAKDHTSDASFNKSMGEYEREEADIYNRMNNNYEKTSRLYEEIHNEYSELSRLHSKRKTRE